MRDALRHLVAAFVALVLSVSPSVEAGPLPGEAEASMGFDLSGVRPFLGRLSEIVEGLSSAQLTSLAQDIAKLPIEATLIRKYNVTFDGKPTTLRVEVFMDDVDAPDLYFYSSKPLAERITAELMKFAEAQGQ